jgi:hypothetical protein
MAVSVKHLIGLALLATLSLVCFILPLALHQAWWSLIALLPLLFVPVPWFFVAPRDSFGSVGDVDADTGRHWAEFFSAFLSLGVLAIPLTLYHVQMIAFLDVVLSCSGSILLFGGWALFVYLQSHDVESYGRG